MRRDYQGFHEWLLRVYEASGLRQADILRRSNEPVYRLKAMYQQHIPGFADDVMLSDLGCSMQIIDKSLLSRLLSGQRAVAESVLFRILRFGFGLSRETCNEMLMLYQEEQGKITTTHPRIAAVTELSPVATIPEKDLPDWIRDYPH